MAARREPDVFRLQIPLDASGIEDFRPDQKVKVVLVDREEPLQSTTVAFDREGRGLATFTFPARPDAMRIVVGPENASDEELVGMQTINLDLSPRQWAENRELQLPPIRISPYYWHWWRVWCRTFTIRGRVLCPDGSPVPGAKVCAFDLDGWWWWLSRQLVGCGTTDASGAFEIKFRWCCGWWPWWWWRYRIWQLEPSLAESIVPVLQRDPSLRKLPSPSPLPTLALFEELLAHDGIASRPPAAVVDPALIPDLRDRLVQRLPRAPELERLHIWPWWPWTPWWDCTPDIVFQVTQDCPQPGTIIVNEGWFDTRWDIPTDLTVTLVASQNSCCIPICHDPRDCPKGNCMVISSACSTLLDTIGGNPGAPPAPVGYANPGVIASGGDRPFAGRVPISGVFGDAASVDYYEFEWSTTGMAPWNPMPPPAAGGVTRTFWGQLQPADPIGSHPVTFPFAFISGRNVIESREHFEANHPLAGWGVTSFWIANRDLLMTWLTENNFADGTYFLRVRGWDLAGGNLVNSRILPLCDLQQENGLALTIDNRVVGLGSGHPPSVPDHPCGSGTVHTCTLEPDTDFTNVTIIDATGQVTSIGACSNVDARNGGTLEIDFMVYDPDGHLAYYTLAATYGENLAVDLLAVGALSVGAAGPVPAALQTGPTYGDARSPMQGAVAPTWAGGMLHLSVPVRLAFPETCCYQLELRAYKRTIVDCDYGFAHANLSEFTFGVTV